MKKEEGDKMKIAIDAMGGDQGVNVMVPGVMQARDQFPEIEFLLFGDEQQIRSVLTNDERIQVIATTEEITYDDEPVKAVRRKKDSSLVRAAQAVKSGEADAMLSAGNTGALMAAGLLYVGRSKQIERPGLMTTLPVATSDGGTDFIDLGANSENKPEHLNSFAILGSVYAKNVRGIQQPRVGLLNNGTEATKGNDVTKAAYQLLEQNPMINFIGNVEARDLLMGVADVVVADGFTGNAVLKATEGSALAVMKLMKQSVFDLGWRGKLGGLLIKPALKKVKAKMDYTDHNGAILMGIKAPILKTHGSSKPQTVVACIDQIKTMLDKNVIPEIEQELAHLKTGQENID